jgi:hypothetical protein
LLSKEVVRGNKTWKISRTTNETWIWCTLDVQPKTQEKKNFIDMIGHIIHQWDMNFSWKLKNDELFILDEPTNYMKPISNIDSKKWLKAMKSKRILYTDKVLTLVDPSERIKPIRCMWIFKRKTGIDTIYKHTKLK